MVGILSDRCRFILEDEETHEVIAAAGIHVAIKSILSFSRQRRCFRKLTCGVNGKLVR